MVGEVWGLFEVSEIIGSLIERQSEIDLAFGRREHRAAALGEAASWRAAAAAAFKSDGDRNVQIFWDSYRRWVRRTNAEFLQNVSGPRLAWAAANQPILSAARSFGAAEVDWPMRLTPARISNLAGAAEAEAAEAAAGRKLPRTAADFRDEYLGQRWSTPLSRELVSEMILVVRAAAQNGTRFAGAADRAAAAADRAAASGGGVAASRAAAAASARAGRVIAAAMAVNYEASAVAARALVRAKAAAE